MLRLGSAEEQEPVIGTLPENCRPVGRLVFMGYVDTRTTSARIDVLANGNIEFQSGKGRYEWMSLSNIRFFVNNDKDDSSNKKDDKKKDKKE